MARRGDGLVLRGKTWWLDFTLWGIRIQVGKSRPEESFVPDEEAKNKGLDAVYYEIQQLVNMVAPTQNSDDAITNAIVESRLTHARNLLEFFGNNPNRDGIIYSHYQFEKPDLAAVRRECRIRLNKDLSHLTYASNKAERCRQRMASRGFGCSDFRLLPFLRSTRAEKQTDT